MYKGSKLFFLIVTVFLLVSLIQVECRRTYGTSNSNRGRGNRGKNQPSGGGIFSSWFGGSKSGSSSSVGSSSAFKPSSTSAKKNWQTATSQASSPSRSSWANPNYKPSAPALPSAPKEANYGWKPAVASNPKPANPPYPSVNSGSRSYPVQSGIQQSNIGGFKPAGSVPSAPATNYQPSQSSFGGYRPASNVPNTHYNPSHSASAPQSGFGGYNTAHSPNTFHSSQPSHGYQPSHGVPHQSYPSSAGYHPSSYPQQTGSFSGHYPTQTGFGYSPHSSFGAAAPTYQGTKLFGGSSGHYGYPGGGSWGVPTYGASRSSSGTGKLLTGLAVGAAGGYLTSSLVNSISNPWKYSGYGYGSRYGYGSSYGPDYGRTSESAFERGYERGARDRQNENTKVTATEAPPEDPTSKWIQCVAFDPQTQQTLINPNCSCTVTTSLDERTQQPLSVHHCTTLNGLVMRPIPINPYPQPPPAGPAVDGQPSSGINTPGVVPSYVDTYQSGNQYGNQYGGVQGGYLPFSTEQKPAPTATEVKAEVSPLESTTSKRETEKGSEKMKAEDAEKKDGESTTGSSTEGSQATSTSSSKSSDSEINKEAAGGSPGADDNRKSTAEFYGQLQKIVNMGNFVDEG